MHSAITYSAQAHRPSTILVFVEHPESVTTGQTLHAPRIPSPRLQTKSACVSAGGSTSIPVSPSGSTIDAKGGGATIRNTMNRSASIPATSAGPTINHKNNNTTINTYTYQLA